MLKRLVVAVGAPLLIVGGVLLMAPVSESGADEPPSDARERAERLAAEASAFITGLREFAWENSDGAPRGVPTDKWVPVNEQLGLICEPVDESPDIAILVVLRGERWRAVRVVNPAESTLLQGLTP